MHWRFQEKALVISASAATLVALLIYYVDGSRAANGLKDLILFASAAAISWVISRAGGRAEKQEELRVFGQQAAERILVLTKQIELLGSRLRDMRQGPATISEVHAIGDQLEQMSVWAEASLRDWEAQLGKPIQWRETIMQGLAGMRQMLAATPAQPDILKQVEARLASLQRELAPPPGMRESRRETYTCPACAAEGTINLGTAPGDTKHVNCDKCSTRFPVHRDRDGSVFARASDGATTAQQRGQVGMAPARPDTVATDAAQATRPSDTRITDRVRADDPAVVANRAWACPQCSRVVAEMGTHIRLPFVRYCFSCDLQLLAATAAELDAPTIRTVVPVSADLRQFGRTWRVLCPCGGYVDLKTTRPWTYLAGVRAACPVCRKYLRAPTPAAPAAGGTPVTQPEGSA